MTPPDPARSVSHRIRNRAFDLGVDPARLRRHLVFQRILARLAGSDRWVLKGGFSLEVRLELRGRATKDLDVVLVEHADSALDLQDLLEESLEADLGDLFTFEVALPVALPAREVGSPGWRARVRARLGGQAFEQVTLDVVAAAEEIGDAVQRIEVEPPLPDARFGSVTVRAVDIPQHAAEKLHAYCRVYARDQPSSRMKDLVDLVLMIEADLLDTDAWWTRCDHVFEIRSGEHRPTELPLPPKSWQEPYEQMSADLGLSAARLDDAYLLVAAHYAKTNAHTLRKSENAPHED